MGAKEVAAGAEWLDENFPGWEREIDLGTLDIDDCQNCVCGQSLRRFATSAGQSGFGVGTDLLYRQYYGGILTHQEMGLIWNSFTIPDADENEPLWVELIKERFSTGNLSG